MDVSWRTAAGRCGIVYTTDIFIKYIPDVVLTVARKIVALAELVRV